MKFKGLRREMDIIADFDFDIPNLKEVGQRKEREREIERVFEREDIKIDRKKGKRKRKKTSSSPFN